MNFMKKTTVKEVAKDTKRQVGRSQRELERERARLEADERKLIAEIKKAAKGGSGGEGHIKVLAKQLVQIRGAKTKLLTMNGQLGAVKTRTTMMAANETMANSLKASTKAMQRANKAMDVGKMTKQMADFERNMEKMNINEEMMNDTLSMLDEEDTEEQVDDITRQVLDEIGVNLDASLDVAPSGAVGSRVKTKAEADEERTLAELTM